MRPIKHFLTHPRDILKGFMARTAEYWPDKLYLRIIYYLHMGKKLHLAKPHSFTEKLNWLKINDIHPEYSDLVDKYEVKKFVKERLGSDEHIIPTYGVWNSFDEIDFNNLPNKFVLKTTGGGGNSQVIRCLDKSMLHIEKTRVKMLPKPGGRRDGAWSREYPYAGIKTRYIAEEYIEAPDDELTDYKFFCFDGEPKFLYVATERNKVGEDLKIDFFDLDFNHLPVTIGYRNASKTPNKPENFKEMIRIASILSKGFKHVRVDLYNVNGKIYFGELTFFNFAGLVPFQPDEWDYKFGEYLNLD